MNKRVDQIKAELAELVKEDNELMARHTTIQEQMALREKELNVLINTPTGEDLTLWLPDELLEEILLKVPIETFWNGTCEYVCRRWRRMVQEHIRIKRRKQYVKWEAYEAKTIKPRVVTGQGCVGPFAIGLDGTIYAVMYNNTIRVWSGTEHAYVYKIERFYHSICSLVVGLDGKLYSGLVDHTIRVWCGTNGKWLYTLEGHNSPVRALAVGIDGNIYSGTTDKTVRVWSGLDGTHLQTIETNHPITSLVVAKDGKIHCASEKAIHVYCGSYHRCLYVVNTPATALAIGPNGNIYSASHNATSVEIWSGMDGTHLQTLAGHYEGISVLVVGSDGKVYAGSRGAIGVWYGTTHRSLVTKKHDGDWSVAVGLDGKMYSCSRRGGTVYAW